MLYCLWAGMVGEDQDSPSMVTHICDPGTQEAETGGWLSSKLSSEQNNFGGGGGVEDVDQLVECLSNMHWAWVLPSVQYKPRMAVHGCNPSNQEVEVTVDCHPWLEASLSYIRPLLDSPPTAKS